MNFSKYLLLAMIGLCVLFVYLLSIETAIDEPIERSTVYKLMMLLTGGAGLFVALTLYHQARSQEEDSEKALELSTINIIKDLWITPNFRLANEYEKVGFDAGRDVSRSCDRVITGHASSGVCNFCISDF